MSNPQLMDSEQVDEIIWEHGERIRNMNNITEEVEDVLVGIENLYWQGAI